jgi:pimeloyl-ACP methyl ester carboxylesterase
MAAGNKTVMEPAHRAAQEALRSHGRLRMWATAIRSGILTARRRRHLAVAGGLLVVIIAAPGCMFRDLRRDLRKQERYAILQGTVALQPGETAGGDVIVVLAYAGEPPDIQVGDTIVLPAPGSYFLLVPVGTFRVVAFEDCNGNRIPDPEERTAILGNGEPIEVKGGQATRGLDLTLTQQPPPGLGITSPVATDAVVGVDSIPRPQLGEIVTLDDPRFTDQAATTGLWRPVEFLLDVGAGIYFLEPYDEERVPVIFVHGALGHPGIWRFLIEQLDRKRFQPWLVYYPTAARLEIIAAAIAQWLRVLAVEHQVGTEVVVAHSMGGLVAREVINHLGNSVGPITLVTISTPWLGHAAAAKGVQQAPVVAPSWYDMSPGSPFLTSLLTTPLPPDVAFTLLFTYGGGSTFSRQPNDGVVTLASQLAPTAQHQATKVLGFDSSHSNVLRDAAVADELKRILASLPK